ncbi:MAG: hypothetical protein A3G83_12595 [Betaproteobacteria bacterium RIFCSPLOWO2_12_FULL_68_20]|nr:MAG: hypothetical protein A3G83_12595 [Betaproteobacteria bacterium RIFCSPLOWO2_12_FULL_68_20]
MRARPREDAPHERQAVASAGERQTRLVTVLVRQRTHGRGGHVGRVADDQVVAPAAQRAEQVRAHEANAPPETMARDIAPRDRERGRGNVGRVDAHARQGAREQHGEAAGPRAQVERLARLARQPWPQPLGQQLGDERARDDGALIDVERTAAEPGFVQQIRDRHPLADPPLHQRRDAAALRRTGGRIEVRAERKSEPPQNEKRGFVAWIAGAVAVVERRGAQAARRVPDQPAERQGRSARSRSR